MIICALCLAGIWAILLHKLRSYPTEQSGSHLDGFTLEIVFGMLVVSGVFGAIARNGFKWITSNIDVPVATILSETLASIVLSSLLGIIYIAIGFAYTGKVIQIISNEEFLSAAIVLTIAGCAAGIFLEEVRDYVKRKLRQSFD